MIDVVLVVAVAVLTPAAACGAFALAWCERRQGDYRCRLLAAPMHQYDGRPCYGRGCLTDEDAA